MFATCFQRLTSRLFLFKFRVQKRDVGPLSNLLTLIHPEAESSACFVEVD